MKSGSLKGWLPNLLGYLEEPGAQHNWKRQFAQDIRGFRPVNVSSGEKAGEKSGVGCGCT
jgi:hypothetical protein